MIETPLGSMVAIADEEALYLLEFFDRRSLERQLKRLSIFTQADIIDGLSEPLKLIAQELKLYFAHELKTFKTPTISYGTPFQKLVWEKLAHIPIGVTCSYLEVARDLGRPDACRAVANAIGANPLALIIPCHRVIAHNGALGGYAGGLPRKEWLLQQELMGARVRLGPK